MDRLNQLRGEAGSSRDSTIDTSSPPSEAYMTANESSSKYFSLSEVDSTFDISPIKDVSLASANIDSEKSITESDQIIPNLSPVGKKSDFLDTYKIGKQIEAANILSGGVNIFDDNDNSYDGDELVIDDNAEIEVKSNTDLKMETQFKEEHISQPTLVEAEPVQSKDTEVILQIDGKNVDAIDIGNGLYLYRKEGQEELAAVQIDDNQQQPSFKFLKVRENAEGNLEVYEEIQIEVPNEVPVKDEKVVDKTVSHVPIKDINKVINDSTSNKTSEKKNTVPNVIKPPITVVKEAEPEVIVETKSEIKSEGNMKMKFNELRKSPVIGSFTPMTFHSTPNKEGIPLTKTMVDQQLHPNRHSDNIKKTIEVHTENAKQKILESPVKQTNDINDDNITKPDVIKSLFDNKESIVNIEQNNKDESCIDFNNTDTDNEEDKMVIDETAAENIDKLNAQDKENAIKIQSEPAIKISDGNKNMDKNTTKIDTREMEKDNDLVEENTFEFKGNDSTGNNFDLENSKSLVTSAEIDVSKISQITKKEKSDSEEKRVEIDKKVIVETSQLKCDEKENNSIVENNTDMNLVETDTKKAEMNISSPTLSSKETSVSSSDNIITDNLNKKASNPELTSASIVSHDSQKLVVVNDPIVQNVAQKSSKIKNESNTIKLDILLANVKDNNTNEGKSPELKDSNVDKSQVIEADTKILTDVKNNDRDSEITAPVDVTKRQEVKNNDSSKKSNQEFSNKLSGSDTNTNVPDNKVEKVTTGVKIIPDTEVKNSVDINQSDCKETKESGKKIEKDEAIKIVDSCKDSVEDLNINKTVTKPECIEQVNKIVCSQPEKKSPLNKSGVVDVIKLQSETEAQNLSVKTDLEKKVCKVEMSSTSLLASNVKETAPKTVNVVTTKTGKDGKSEIINDHKVSTSPANVVNVFSVPCKNIQQVQPSIKLDVNEAKTQVTKSSVQNIPLKDISEKKVPPKIAHPDTKPINNNHAAVPFGKWTEVNRQAFLNKIKESKVPTNSSNGKQIKNSNDLNRRDVLKKIDSQRQSSIATAKAQELANAKLGVKKESAFVSKTSLPKDIKPVKSEAPILKANSLPPKKPLNQKIIAKPQTVTTGTLPTNVRKESMQRKEINNQDLIDKTIEDIINRTLPVKSSSEDSEPQNQPATTDTVPPTKSKGLQPTTQTGLDEIEMKMNELHGIPFIERPAHELPCHVVKPGKVLPKQESPKSNIKPSKIPNLLPFIKKGQQKGVKESVIDVDSEEEILEHEPITGDMELDRKLASSIAITDNGPMTETLTLISADSSKKETIITERDFDKFVRRNSITYENCITVNYDGKEHHNVVQTIVQKDIGVKTYSKQDTLQSDPKIVSQFTQKTITEPISSIPKFANPLSEESNKNYQSKVKMAYQTAMTAKRHLERPLIEDKPVKVVFVDSHSEFISSQLNVQGKDLSPCKKTNSDLISTQTNESLDSDTLDSIDEGKLLDDGKLKTKHQRKQVLTPVEAPELELIEPHDLGMEVSPKKKRRTEEKLEKSSKTLVPKKTYLLGRSNTTEDSSVNVFDLSKNAQRETLNQENTIVSHKNTASAIDSLVKAAELLETQSGNISSNVADVVSADTKQTTPVKRGRGRPRKHPVPEGASTGNSNKVPSPQKKPRLIDAKKEKSIETDDDDDDDADDDSSSEGRLVKENWTMGKINENIVCPICNKLFRSENVVFKHVKHCTGPSPSRSDSDNRSPRRLRDSQESETRSYGSKSDDMDIDDNESLRKEIRTKQKSKDSHSKIPVAKDEVIVIEDTPVKAKIDKRDERKPPESRKTINATSRNKVLDKVSSLVCEFCGKSFRQLSYLVNHKLQHEKDDANKNEDESMKANKSVFSCEVCKKEFRKLHHLVQHRIIHNPSNASAKLSRKSSSEQNENKSSKDSNLLKHTDDPSAGFRCEPCDKSFRKLHHLVEHRETHDGINRQKITTSVPSNVDKLPPPPQCDICKKTFRKLHHLIDHKEQHLETSSEKSDDKSIKSSLSTKDIIHECSLCYMVFPNEHSLTKHTVICQRKKRQSASKQIKQAEGDNAEAEEEAKSEENKLDDDDEVIIISAEANVEKSVHQEQVKHIVEEKKQVVEETIKLIEPKEVTHRESPKSANVPDKVENKEIQEVIQIKTKVEELQSLPIKENKIDLRETKPKVQDTPRRKTSLRDKVAPTVTKRHKPNIPLEPIDDKPIESSDDDEIRYMLNPDYKFEDNEGKIFMKVRANKRNSLQIERPNSKDLVKRRISLQHPPKVPRLKPKLNLNRPTSSTTLLTSKPILKAPKLDPVPSNDSDDSDVKYSFPPPAEETTKQNVAEVTKIVKRTQRKSLAAKRKSLGSIAKRKSLGKSVAAALKNTPSRRQTVVEHKCDCGEMFSSAALLSRHTTQSHTPPRIRRRRSPPPEIPTKTDTKPAPRKSSTIKPRPSAESRKSSTKSDAGNPKSSAKSDMGNAKTSAKSDTSNAKTSAKSDTSNAKTSAKNDTSNVKLSAKSDTSNVKPSAKSDSSNAKTSTKSDTSNAKSSSKSGTSNPKTSLKRKTSNPKVSSNSDANITKPSTKSDTSKPKPSAKRKSITNKTELRMSNENHKSPKPGDKTDTIKSATSDKKLRRYAAHKGVPVPEKMRKLMEKSKK